VLGVDQLTKALAVARLQGGPVDLLGPLRLELAYNRGVAFSLLSGLTVPIVIVVVALVVLLTRFARSVPTRVAAVAVGMVIGGALGNLADRLVRAHGEVVDFLYTGFWPTFNLADASIVCGGAILAVSLWRAGKVTSRSALPS
jgi:signal peptidase II